MILHVTVLLIRQKSKKSWSLHVVEVSHVQATS